MAGWVVKLNGTILKKISKVTVKEDLGKPMKFFEATMRHPSDSERTTLEAARGHLIGSHRIQIYRKGIEKFDGFLEAADPVGLDFILQGRSHEVLLLDERTSQDVECMSPLGCTGKGSACSPCRARTVSPDEERPIVPGRGKREHR